MNVEPANAELQRGPRATPVIDRVAIVVPARNEAHNIGSTIRSLRAARRALGPEISSSLTVVADSCDDATITAALALIDPKVDRVVACRVGNVGIARRLGTDSALERLGPSLSGVWLAHTDADTQVPVTWLTRQLEHARRGVVGVAGVVHLDPSRSLPPELIARFGRRYVVEGELVHAHVHGANLAMLAVAYRRAGGWGSMATGEDHDLWNRLRACGPVVSDSLLSVATDPRRVGRAPLGFAADLAADLDPIASDVA